MYYVITKGGMKSSSSLEKLNNMLDAKLRMRNLSVMVQIKLWSLMM